VSVEEIQKPSSEITFEAFFVKCVLEGKLKDWQRQELRAFFFTDMKLREKEDLERSEYLKLKSKYEAS
jgi:hypothetical protein